MKVRTIERNRRSCYYFLVAFAVGFGFLFVANCDYRCFD